MTGDDPYDLARAIRRSGQWGIAALAYGAVPGNINNLAQIAAGERCVYHVGYVDDLNINGKNFLQGLTCL